MVREAGPGDLSQLCSGSKLGRAGLGHRQPGADLADPDPAGVLHIGGVQDQLTRRGGQLVGRGEEVPVAPVQRPGAGGVGPAVLDQPGPILPGERVRLGVALHRHPAGAVDQVADEGAVGRPGQDARRGHLLDRVDRPGHVRLGRRTAEPGHGQPHRPAAGSGGEQGRALPAGGVVDRLQARGRSSTRRGSRRPPRRPAASGGPAGRRP